MKIILFMDKVLVLVDHFYGENIMALFWEDQVLWFFFDEEVFVECLYTEHGLYLFYLLWIDYKELVVLTFSQWSFVCLHSFNIFLNNRADVSFFWKRCGPWGIGF